MEALDSTAVARMGLILGHLLAFALATVGIAFGDLAIFRKRRVDADMLATSKLLEEIDPAHLEAFDRLTARKLRGELSEAA